MKPYEIIPRVNDHRSSIQNCDPHSTDGSDGTDTTDQNSTDNEEDKDGTTDKVDNDVEKDVIGER